MSINLSLLICTIEGREEQFFSLYRNLSQQIQEFKGDNSVEILFILDNKEISIGEKRQKLLLQAKGKFVCWVDDDDTVPINYVRRINNVIIQNPNIDCIGIKGVRITDNKVYENWACSTKYIWTNNVDNYNYVHYIDHLCPVRREHALAAGFPFGSLGEDFHYSMRLKALNVLKNEYFINQVLYTYNYISPKSQDEIKAKYGPWGLNHQV